MSLDKIFGLILVVTLLLQPGGARASAVNQCIDGCFSSYSCVSAGDSGNQIVCEGQRSTCLQQCSNNANPHDDPPPVTGAFGAIAYDKKSGAWGMADASKDKGSAEDSAMGYCKQHGPDCEVVESFSNTCSAVASGTGNRLGWAVNESAKRAGLDAIKKCGDSGDNPDGSRCFLQLYHCYHP